MLIAEMLSDKDYLKQSMDLIPASAAQ